MAFGKDYDSKGVRFVKKQATDIPSGIAPERADFFPIPEWPIDIRANTWMPAPIAEFDYDDPEDRLILDRGIFRLKIQGDCMEPTYRDGSRVEFQLVRVDQHIMIPGRGYAVCKSDGTATFKIFKERVDDDMLRFLAVNQRKYPGYVDVARQEIGRLAVVVDVLNGLPPDEVPKTGKA